MSLHSPQHELPTMSCWRRECRSQTVIKCKRQYRYSSSDRAVYSCTPWTPFGAGKHGRLSNSVPWKLIGYCWKNEAPDWLTTNQEVRGPRKDVTVIRCKCNYYFLNIKTGIQLLSQGYCLNLNSTFFFKKTAWKRSSLLPEFRNP